MHRQFVDSLQIENPILEKRLLNAVEKLEEPQNERDCIDDVLAQKHQYIENCIKNVNDCMDVLRIQMANHQNTINGIYGEVIERANKYKAIALDKTTQIYETKFALLTLKLDAFKKMQLKILQVPI